MTMPELKLSAVGFKEKLPIYTNDIIGNPLYTNSLMQYTDSVRLGDARPNMDIRLFPELKNNHIQIMIFYFKWDGRRRMICNLDLVLFQSLRWPQTHTIY